MAITTIKGSIQNRVSSETAPVTPNEGMFWYQTTTGKLYIYYTDAGSSQWVEVAGGGSSPSVSAEVAPIDPYDGMIWYDTANARLYIYYADDDSSQWIEAGGQYSTSAANALQSVYSPAGTGAVDTDVQTKLRESISVKDFGAVGDGVTNDTVAVEAALNAAVAGGRVVFPTGIYLCDPMVIANANDLTMEGDNKMSSILRLSGAGTLLTFQNAQWVKVHQMSFDTNAVAQAMAGAIGLRFDLAAGNNTVDDCNFIGFIGGGLSLIGVVGTQLSGHKVTNCYFLGNGGDQLLSVYSNDWHIDSNQFGRLAGITQATHGCWLQDSSAGTYTRNLHWDNDIALKATTCNYNTYTSNRFEDSATQNVYFTGGSYTIFSNNRVHTASKSSTGTYDNAHFDGMAYLSVVGNMLFSFSAVLSKWGINIGTGCSFVTMSKNQVDDFHASYGPYNISSTLASLGTDFSITGIGGPSAANQVTYLGNQLNTFTEALAITAVPSRCQAVMINAASDAVPGGSDTYINTLRVAGADTAMTATTTSAAFGIKVYNTTPAILVATDASVGMKLTTSATAAAGNHRWSVSFLEY